MIARSYQLLSVFALCVSCGSSTTPTEKDDEDAISGGGGASSGGTLGSGGSGAGGGTGGNPSSGGSEANGGATGGAVEMGGAATGGTYVVPDDAVSSAGCTLPAIDPQDLMTADGTLLVSTPEGYDGSTPLPLVVAFGEVGGSVYGLLQSSDHASTTSELARDYVVVRARASKAPQSTWEGLEVDAFENVYRAIEENLCFDTSRVFGIGNEGGARYLTQQVCEDPSEGMMGPNIFRALALVGFQAGSCHNWPSIPLLFLHSTETGCAGNDPDGQKALATFRERKNCEETSTPAGIWPTANEDFSYECQDFNGCTSPLRFCSWDKPIDCSDFWLREHNVHVHRFFTDYQ